MKQALFLLLFLSCFSAVNAKHITGGEMIYEYTGSSAPGFKYFRITLRLFRDENCVGCADMPATVSIGVFNNDNGTRVGAYHSINISSSQIMQLNALPPCLTNQPNLTYRAGYYSFIVELPDNNAGYTATYQTCCRIDGIRNVPNSIGATYIAQIPGKNTLGAAGTDSSPQFAQKISVVCYNRRFTLDFSAFDPNPGDSLVYGLCGGFDGGAAGDASFSAPSPPPYSELNYINGYSGTNPLGAQATINPQTGIISGIAPDAGKYVVSVCVSTYRNGQYIGQHRKDFIITVAPCSFAGAELNPDGYRNCDDRTLNFVNLNDAPENQTFFWDFGDPASPDNISTEAAPIHTFSDAGVYTIKLVVNRGLDCSDSATAVVRVFPGFFPAFNDNSPMCKGIPVQFGDLTTANYGIPNNWHWDFGNTQVSNDISVVKNPTYTYNTPGSYAVQLIVGSDKGCIDTLTRTITIVDKPVLTLTNDTLICSIDTLQLSAATTAAGTITWSPNYNINDVHSFTPQVWPKSTTTYSVAYSDNFGCSTTDNVVVKVVDSVTLQAGNDTAICQTDPTVLQLNSNALHYEWTPPETLSDPSIKNPVATPLSLTTYHVRATIGKCVSNDQVTVKPVPYPVVTKSPDTSICFGTSAFLRATGGSIYTWTPASFLSATNIPNPTAVLPTSSVNYTVAVRDTFGCPKPVTATIALTVVKVVANAGPRDTAVVLGQPLQLNATGNLFYLWTPSTWLNNPVIPDPIALPQDSIEYVVKVSNADGCFGTDTIKVKLYKVEPDLFVPSAFTPNGDGNNDVFRPIPIGMRSLDAFRVYNRWGQLLFSTTEQGRGWDGKLGGMGQDSGTYVWYAEGVDYKGKKIQRKGYVVLIR
jgi:gliding motility-associated-like protein